MFMFWDATLLPCMCTSAGNHFDARSLEREDAKKDERALLQWKPAMRPAIKEARNDGGQSDSLPWWHA
jgi:hypothetical protein